eukprot:scaffold259698_cov27-Tisochrysis_lutea.AAC.2
MAHIHGGGQPLSQILFAGSHALGTRIPYTGNMTENVEPEAPCWATRRSMCNLKYHARQHDGARAI